METKKSLRRQLEKARGLAKELNERLWHAEWALTGAETALDNLGYEPVDVQHPVFDRPERDWRLTEAQSAKNSARDVELAEHHDVAKADAWRMGHREALALVIEALEIPGYRTDPIGDALRGRTQDPIDRFHADLTTAVEVRRDIAAASERGKVEKKVSELLKREPKSRATGGLVAPAYPGEKIISKADLAASAAAAMAQATQGNPHAAAATIFDTAKQAVDHDVATAGEKLEDAA